MKASPPTASSRRAETKPSSWRISGTCLLSYQSWYAAASSGEAGRDSTISTPRAIRAPFGLVVVRGLVDVSVFHDEPHVLGDGDVLCRVAGDGDDVGEVALPQLAELTVQLDEFRAGDRRRPQGLYRRHSAGHQRGQFPGVVAVRDRGGVGAAGYLDAGGDGPGEHGPGAGEHLGRFLLQLRRGAGDVHGVGEVGGRHQERAVVGHHLEGVVAGEEAVLDAVDPGPAGCPHRCVAYRVGGDADAGPVRLVGDRLQFLVGVLLASWTGAV